MVAVCTAFKPPAINNAKAIPETNTPQMILVRFFGFTSPSVLIVANTKVAESPEVMKNTKIKIVAKIEVNQANGNSPNKANNANELFCPATSAKPEPLKISLCKAAPPKILNHTKPTKVGAITTPSKN